MATAFTADITVDLTDLYTITGSTAEVTELQLVINKAQSIIETISGVFFSAQFRDVTISGGDAAWLKKATMYQAQFMLENPDVLSRTGVTSLSQDGVSVSAPDGLTFILAPLARRALGNVSWAKAGTLRVAPAEVQNTDGSFLTDDNHAWSPLGAV